MCIVFGQLYFLRFPIPPLISWVLWLVSSALFGYVDVLTLWIIGIMIGYFWRDSRIWGNECAWQATWRRTSCRDRGLWLRLFHEMLASRISHEDSLHVLYDVGVYPWWSCTWIGACSDAEISLLSLKWVFWLWLRELNEVFAYIFWLSWRKLSNAELELTFISL